ncbi:MAG: hypothetical protein KGJ23_08780 [Euryarchaeota archaeon]|nr:hypothetical protein [Euryarchaeota archaeon]MDE1836698.1 hypothetical protein [Euryarchaeota archaeon]MDE1880273.1 hypothetical protein [Euryarchaeota archaeon]MDE2044668.1 hypothetical protein [Thermoplasmata archaeon]
MTDPKWTEGLTLKCEDDGKTYEFVAEGTGWPRLLVTESPSSTASMDYTLDPHNPNGDWRVEDGFRTYDYLCKFGKLTDLRGLLVLWKVLANEGKEEEWWGLARYLAGSQALRVLLQNHELRVLRLERAMEKLSRVVNF